MNTLLAAAAGVLVATGAAHSILGERLLLRPLRRAGVLRRQQFGIVWASWHLVTVLGLVGAGVLLWSALPPAVRPPAGLLVQGTALALALCAALVAWGTRGRHPGWAALLLAALLAAAA